MNSPALLVLVRHGQSVANELLIDADGPFCPTEEIAAKMKALPHHSVPLTERGRWQAQHAGEILRDWFFAFDVIIDSGFTRAEQTADLIARQFRLAKRLTDARFRERDPGYGYGMTRREFNHHFPWMQAYWDRTSKFLARPIGGESIVDVVYGRVQPALKDVFERFNGQRVLIVAHGRTIQAAQILLEKLPTDGMRLPVAVLPNCGCKFYQNPDLA